MSTRIFQILYIQFLAMHSARSYNPQPAEMRPSSAVRYHWSPDCQAGVVQPRGCRRKMANIDIAQERFCRQPSISRSFLRSEQYGTTFPGHKQAARKV
jgi:hypothetical protein